MTERVEVEGRVIEVSSPEKVLFPVDGITKRDVVEYYRRMAGRMIPYMRDRPLTMHRFPNGIEGQGFYQKEAPDYFPEWVERAAVEVLEEGQSQPQVICQDAATLVYLASQACLTPHIWLSRVDRLDYPDKLIFDLDPPANDFELVRLAARTLHGLLEALELPSFVMTTGSKGLHVVIPLDRSADFDTVRAFAREVAEVVASRAPERLTTETRKEKRQGRLFLDYLRNAYGQNSVTPYAIRAKPGAPVATPLEWAELAGARLHSQRYTIRNIFRRLARKKDPWEGMMGQAGGLGEARGRLDGLRA